MVRRTGTKTEHAKPITRDELHLAFARVPNTAGYGGFDQALNSPAVVMCLQKVVLMMRRKKRVRFV